MIFVNPTEREWNSFEYNVLWPIISKNTLNDLTRCPFIKGDALGLLRNENF